MGKDGENRILEPRASVRSFKEENYSMAKDSSLSKAVRDFVKIEKFIFQVMIKGEDEPRTMTRVDLEPKQRAFFANA